MKEGDDQLSDEIDEYSRDYSWGQTWVGDTSPLISLLHTNTVWWWGAWSCANLNTRSEPIIDFSFPLQLCSADYLLAFIMDDDTFIA